MRCITGGEGRDEEARALGVEAGRLRLGVVVAVTVITASAVSINGIIGWVGLVVPHLARMVVGPDYTPFRGEF
ncbi:iron chelate uptake ABC transporter family permease subunit [Pseudodesulfovibrio sediminis]|uniref:Uncharacterized protein n=1 Tax=Pseudodesulfovibrio sediminis TaxID=2810563 RepID=A0ABM7P5S8_9BACT|nr:iron chelate uptake ABC transporter family permease subunit [Pseudodesulfovibrio sediminis]BCS88282.1 hypothetical protein PSDVSF_15240 [Pseudodesulfovibrio sediminis]